MIPKIVQQLTYWPIFLTLKIIFKYEIEGQENLKGLEDKSVIFASNHASYVDGPISAASMPRESLVPTSFFPIRFLAAKSFFGIKNSIPFPISLLTALYVRANGSIPIIRGAGDLSVILKAPIKMLKENKIKLWIYPEGKMTRDGNIGKGKRGVAFLHQQTVAPIVPVAISGNFRILNLTNLFKSILGLRKLKIKIGKPIYSLGGVSLEEGTEKVMEKIGKLKENN